MCIYNAKKERCVRKWRGMQRKKKKHRNAAPKIIARRRAGRENSTSGNKSPPKHP